MPACHNAGMSDDLHARARQWWAEARRKSLEDEAEVEAWKAAHERDGVSFFLPGAKWSIWDWVDHNFRRETFWRDRYAERQGIGREDQ
jgi:hypothetical protein